MHWRRRVAVACALVMGAVSADAQQAAQFRGYWLDTFNTALNTPADVVAAVDGVARTNANALFVQVRRRGDVWYMSAYEDFPDGVPIAAGFDPLGAVIAEAHARGIQVHAFMPIAAVYGRHPVILGVPTDPDHVFNRHGGFDATTGLITPGPDNWLTRTLLPDGAGGVTFQGHRIGSDFWVDLGHPDAARYAVDLAVDLIERYDLDGLHLDRIRYPEIGVAGQTPTTGANIGYNPTSVDRFQRHRGIAAGSPPPAPGDAAWAQWRRDQVSAVVRRVYLETIARKPQMVVSAATIAFGGGPAPTAWPSAEAYWRVYQDWRAWTEEGILDLTVPMLYQREHTAAGATNFTNWLTFLRAHQYDRAIAAGQATYLNSIEGSLRQTRRALSSSSTPLAGVLFYSLANPDVAVPANPLSLPAGQNTPRRGLNEFASGYTTGRSVDGTVAYEDPAVSQTPIYGMPAPVPVFSWKQTPTVGHVKGIVRDEQGAIVDTGAVALLRAGDTPASGRTDVTTSTDGNGFYGGVDLAAGTWHAVVTPSIGVAYRSCPIRVEAGRVTTADIPLDRAAPTSSLVVSPERIWPVNDSLVPVTVSGSAEDVGLGLTGVVVRLADEYGEVAPAPIDVALSGDRATWSATFHVPASRRGADPDGRTFAVEVTVSDAGCNATTLTSVAVVPHDQRPTATQ